LTNREEKACQKMIACGGWIIRTKKQVEAKQYSRALVDLNEALKNSVAAVGILREGVNDKQ
jgi:hypothetical protein